MSSKKRTRLEVDAANSVANGNRKRASVEKAKDLDIVMQKCRALRTALREKDEEANGPGKPLPESVKSEEIVEVAELSATEVLEGIEGVALKIAHQVLAKKGFTLDVPSRSASNQLYVKEWDRIVLGGKRSTRTFLNVRVSDEISLAGFVGESNNRLSSAHPFFYRNLESRRSHFESCNFFMLSCRNEFISQSVTCFIPM